MLRAHATRIWVTGTVLLGLLGAHAAAGAEFYQWRDAQGKLHFGQEVPPGALEVERRGAPDPVDPGSAPALPPAPAVSDHPAFTWEEPEAGYRLRFPAGWDTLPKPIVTQVWSESMAARIDAAFYYETTPGRYSCPCALVARMPAGDDEALVAARYESLPLRRGLGADPVAATAPGEPPVVYFDPESGQFWFRQETAGGGPMVNTTLTILRRTVHGGVMLTVVQPRSTLASYADVVLPVVAGLEPIGEVAPLPPSRALPGWLVGMSLASGVLGIVGWRRGGPKRALLFGSAPPLSGLAFLLAAAANPQVAAWEQSVRIGHLLGLSLGLPVLAFAAALAQRKTRSLDRAVRWYVGAVLVCLVVYGVNAVRVVGKDAPLPPSPAEARPADAE